MKVLKKILFILGILVAVGSVASAYLSVRDMVITDYIEGIVDGYKFGDPEASPEVINGLFLGDDHRMKYYTGFAQGNYYSSKYTIQEVRENLGIRLYEVDPLEIIDELTDIIGSMILFVLSIILIIMTKKEILKRKSGMALFIIAFLLSGGSALVMVYGTLGIIYSLLIDKEPTTELRFKKGVFVLGILVSIFAVISMIDKVVELSVSDFESGYNDGLEYSKVLEKKENPKEGDIDNSKGNEEVTMGYYRGYTLGAFGDNALLPGEKGIIEENTKKLNTEDKIIYVFTIIVFFFVNMITLVLGILISKAYRKEDVSRILQKLLIFAIIIFVLGNHSPVTLALAVLVLVGRGIYKEENPKEKLAEEAIEEVKDGESVEEVKTGEAVEEEKAEETVEEVKAEETVEEENAEESVEEEKAVETAEEEETEEVAAESDDAEKAEETV